MLTGLFTATAFAQDKMSGSGMKLNHQQMMDKMNTMSADDKAAM
jgi:hypothetical protein